MGVGLMPGVARAATPSEELTALAKHVDTAIARLQVGDVDAARTEYLAFDDGWFDIEDGIRAVSRARYRTIEDAMGDAKYALTSTPPDSARALEALQRLRSECDGFIAEAGTGEPSPAASQPRATTTDAQAGIQGLLARIDSALARIDAGDATGAVVEVNTFREEWTDVEGLVKVRSASAYTNSENNMAKAAAQLQRQPPDMAGARDTLTAMKTELTAVAESGTHYGVFDAAIILLREGLEALLVVGALLAFLARMGHSDKAKWIWVGCAAAIAASVAVAAVVNLLFARAAGANRELLEGVTGLVAAVMLVYMSYWLHSKASLGAWQRYIQDKGTAALSQNSLFSLAFLAFLAVFREGAETVLFYAGIAPSIAMTDLLLGLAIGFGGLVIAGVVMFRLGMKLPIRPFFLVATVLIYYLAFKFVGMGVHALQVAGYVPATPAPFLPENAILGLYPTWETTIAQLVLIAVTGGLLILERINARSTTPELARRPSAG
jgi:high-affinity iron transporter